MSTFMDGPAAAAGLMLKRAPLFLRVVIDETDATVDALDQLDDTPGPSERVHVYERVGPSVRAHLCYRGRQKGQSGWYESGHYKHRADVDGEQLRETAAWREWCRAQTPAEMVR